MRQDLVRDLIELGQWPAVCAECERRPEGSLAGWRLTTWAGIGEDFCDHVAVLLRCPACLEAEAAA